MIEITKEILETEVGIYELSKKLIEEYPWLNAYNFGYLYIVGDVPEEHRKEYDGECLLLDLPVGWLKGFAIDMCEEIKNALKKAKIAPEDYKIEQIKEKYGMLRWYAVGGNNEIDEIIRKYEKISAKTCCLCGEKAVYRTKGYIMPYCEKCVLKDWQVQEI